MHAKKPPKNAVAVTPNGSITLDMLVGFYALFSVPDAPVSANKLARAWAAEGLPTEFVPKGRRSSDTFKQACRSIETRRRDSSRTTEIKVDRVLEDDQRVAYQITHMVRDEANVEIDHPKAMRATLRKSTEDLMFEPLEDCDLTELNALSDAIREFFDKNKSTVPGSRVRTAVRLVMDHEHATLIRKGVYFVPVAANDSLQSLERVLEFLYKEDALAHFIPCADAEGEKALIERQMTEQVSNEVDEMLTELATRLHTGKIRRDRLGALIMQRRNLSEHRRKYRELLDSELDVLESKFDVLDTQLDKLTSMTSHKFTD